MALTKQEQIDALTHTLFLAVIAKTEKEKNDLVKAAVKIAEKLPNKTVERCKQLAELKLFERKGKLIYIGVDDNGAVH
jgi:hypothetical protein